MRIPVGLMIFALAGKRQEVRLGKNKARVTLP